MTAEPVHYTNPEIVPSDDNDGTVVLKYGYGPLPPHLSNKKIFFFDIDNCLYKRSTRIHDLMQVKIHQYFKESLSLNDEDAHNLHHSYYTTYGLALEGLVRNHKVDALEYNSKVDDLLDLKQVLHTNGELRAMLTRMREHYDVFWLITNAYKNHALRVISFLGLGHLFDGLTYCDYLQFPIVCKPMDEFYFRTLATTQVDRNDPEALRRLTFVDDSEINVKAALRLGFGTVVHFVELDSDLEAIRAKPDFAEYYSKDNQKIRIIRDILELETL